MTQGSEYEFWEENTYNAYENVYRCLAYRDYGNFVRLVQGIGSDCNGISGELSMDNAFRTMDLQKVRRDLTQCDFPLWVRGKTWKVVARGGMRSLGTPQADNQPRQVSFTDSNSFILGTEVSKFCLFHIQYSKNISGQIVNLKVMVESCKKVALLTIKLKKYLLKKSLFYKHYFFFFLLPYFFA